MNKVHFYEIDSKYITYLNNVDRNVSLEHPNANSRKFLGVVCIVNNNKYYAPLSSPKPKHAQMKEGSDFYKIKGGELGIINLNNMIPVDDSLLKIVEITQMQDLKYQKLMMEQLRIIRNEIDKIKKKANKLNNIRYKPYTGNTLKNRCSDFLLLEKKLSEYIGAN